MFPGNPERNWPNGPNYIPPLSPPSPFARGGEANQNVDDTALRPPTAEFVRTGESMATEPPPLVQMPFGRNAPEGEGSEPWPRPTGGGEERPESIGKSSGPPAALPGINEQYIPPRAEDHPSYPFSRRDQEIEELLDNVFSADSPEYQTAPGLSLDERTNLCDIIDRIVEEFPDKLVLPWRIIPEALIARHRISYDIVEITKKPLMVPDDVDPFTHTIQATRRVRGDRVDIIEDKEVLFTRCEGHPIEVEERAHAIWPGETLPAKPLTVAELRRIQQALRDLYQES